MRRYDYKRPASGNQQSNFHGRPPVRYEARHLLGSQPIPEEIFILFGLRQGVFDGEIALSRLVSGLPSSCRFRSQFLERPQESYDIFPA